MSTAVQSFSAPYAPAESMVPGLAVAACRACVTIPARDEEKTLATCLDALAAQVSLNGAPLPRRSFEVLLLLNNCQDRSVVVAQSWRRAHPEMALHCVERTFPSALAHAGTARKLLLDTGYQRLGGLRLAPAALLCTDADSAVAPDWIAQNLHALECGADAVGGQIELYPTDLQGFSGSLRRCYERDRRYGELVAHLEDLLDPQAGDPWPRHQHHFGSSLACTPQAYAAAGGLPDAPTLEDEAFVHQLRRAGLHLRHDPAVRVFTSARLHGRAKVGLARQLRVWNQLPNEKAHRVQSAAFLAHRFQTLHRLREAFSNQSLQALHFPTAEWRQWASVCLQQQGSTTDFLAAIDSDGLIASTFTFTEREQPIEDAIAALETGIAAYEG